MKKMLLILFALGWNCIAAHAGVVNQGPGKGIFAVSGGVTYTVVQSSCSNTIKTASPLTLTFPNSVVAGNTIIASFVDEGNAMATGNVTDNKSNPTYSMRPEGGSGDGTNRVGIWVSTNITTGGTSFQVSVALPTVEGCIIEVSGITAFDSSNTGLASGTTATTNSITPTGTSDFCAGMMTKNATSGTTITESNGTTLIGKDENNSADQCFSNTYKVISVADSLQWLITSDTYKTVGACFK